MQTARVLSNGNYLLAWCGNPATIMEVNAKGEILSKTDFDTRIEQPHAQFRQVNKNKRGNYLVPLFATSEIREISPSGQLLKSVKVDGNPFSVAALDNGNYLVACGDAHCFIELNFETGDIVRKMNANDIEGAQLFFVAQLLPKTGTNKAFFSSGRSAKNCCIFVITLTLLPNKKNNILFVLKQYTFVCKSILFRQQKYIVLLESVK
jgi:hypothetical protein